MQFPLRLSHLPATILVEDIAPDIFRSYWPRHIGYGSFQQALSFFVGNLPRPHQPVLFRHWLRGMGSNHRPQAYEACELPTALPRDMLKELVPEAGLEPTREYSHGDLSSVCLPITPLRRVVPREGFEPSRCYQQQGLSLPCLPFHHLGIFPGPTCRVSGLL